jgi:hypothetical protein
MLETLRNPAEGGWGINASAPQAQDEVIIVWGSELLTAD